MSDRSPLSPNEEALLRIAPEAAGFAIASLLDAAGLSEAQAQSAAESLYARGLLEREEQTEARLVIGDMGLALAEAGLPELQLRARLAAGPCAVKDAQALEGLDRAVVGKAFGALKKAGLVQVDGPQVSLGEGPGWATLDALQSLLRALRDAGEAGLPWEQVPTGLHAAVEERLPRGRGKKGETLLERVELKRRRYGLTAAGRQARDGLGEARPQAAQLTGEMLKDGSWRQVEFRRFNIAAPPHVPTGRRNPYRAYLDLVKRKLLAMGFEEMTGSLVQQEFWNMDALFLPQFHPAREIQDVYFVEEPESGGYAYAQEVEGGALEPVAREHEGRGRTGSRGWSYDFDRQRTKRLVLRSQGTVLSARWLQRARVPGKYFGIARCFRYDTVDATHAPDFFQVEGIVTSEQTSFLHLLGLLKVFAYELARSKEVKFVPGYFPFTEPSVEVHMKHERLGWVELGGAGIFRPEVTEPHGITTPVIAWGLGLDRMAMVALGIDDIRHLFTNSLPHGLRDLRRLVAR